MFKVIINHPYNYLLCLHELLKKIKRLFSLKCFMVDVLILRNIKIIYSNVLELKNIIFFSIRDILVS